MFLAIGNLLAHFGDWLVQNRARLLRLALIAAAAVLVVVGVERFKNWRYEKRVQALEQQRSAAELKAKQAEDRAKALETQIQIGEAQLKDIEARAEAAEKALQSIRNVNVTLKGNYEAARDNPMPFTPISVIDACIQLAELGRPCQ